MAIELIWKHQQKAYELMKETLKKVKRAAYIFPTGCGKTFPALKYVEENPDKTVLIVSPSIGINNQFKKYIKQYVENGEERLKNKNISIISYQKLSLLLKRARGAKPDIVILDELHRAGAETWEPAIDELLEQNPNVEVIGMTATPERTDERNMAYEKFGDNVVYEMSLTEALSGEKEGEVVLQTPRYVRVLSELKMVLDEYKKRIDVIRDPVKKEIIKRRFQKLETIVSNSPDVPDVMLQGMKKRNGKYIVFCKDKEDMKEKMENAQQIFGKVNSKINVDYVFSGDASSNDILRKTAKQNKKTLEDFESRENGDELHLLFCVDKLNEGVHIEGIDGEVLFDLTSSPILYKQRIGRVLSSDKSAGDSVIIDVANNWLNQIDIYKEIEAAIRKGGSKQNAVDYDLLRLTPEEIDLIEIMREIGEEFKYNSNKAYEEIIAWLETHNGIMPRSGIKYDNVRIKPSELTPEERAEVNLYQRWNNSAEFTALKQYEGTQLEDIPEEYREKIAKLREFGYGFTAYESFINWLETHDGQMPRTQFIRGNKRIGLTVEQMTKEEHDEKRVYDRWRVCKEAKILEEYAGRPIEEVPEEYRDKIEKLRSFGLGQKEKSTYEKIIEWLDAHDGRMPRQKFSRNGKIVRLSKKEMTPEECYERNLGAKWYDCKEKKILDQYAGRPIEDVPEEYRAQIAKLRSYGLGAEKEDVYLLMIDWLKTHDGRRPRTSIGDFKREELNEEQRNEIRLGDKWNNCKEKKILDQYIGRPIEEVPEEYRSKIAILRQYGFGIEKNDAYEEIIKWLEQHDGKLPRSMIQRNGTRIPIDKMTNEEHEEVKLYKRWASCKEKEVLDKYFGKALEEVPEEFREKIATLRSYGMGVKAKTIYEQIVEWLEKHDQKIPRQLFQRNGILVRLTIDEMTQEERDERILRQRWDKSSEKRILNEFAGRPIEEVPEDYREKIARLRQLGQLGKKRDDSIRSKMKNSVANNVGNNLSTRDELHDELEKTQDEAEQE